MALGLGHHFGHLTGRFVGIFANPMFIQGSRRLSKTLERGFGRTHDQGLALMDGIGSGVSEMIWHFSTRLLCYTNV